MAKSKASYVCQACGAVHPRWMGRCDACGEWNSVIEEVSSSAPIGRKNSGGAGRGRPIEMSSLADTGEPVPRRKTGIQEFDRVTGGGLVRGSAILIGGDPGIGKSTLLLQVTARLAKGTHCAYITGEEAVDQVQMRARRLGVEQASVSVAAATNLSDILATLDAQDGPDLVVIDSIQTMYIDALDSAPGTVAQVRASAQELIRLAKKRGFVLLIVGHVTKEGAIAGPLVLEHMVDTVLYFEGERGHQFRILRAVKNRFGATDEIGVFEMNDQGLSEVENPSPYSRRPTRRSGRLCRLRGYGRHPAGPRRGAGTCCVFAFGDAAARRRRMGFRTSCNGIGRPRIPMRPQFFRWRGLSKRRRWASNWRTRR